ncbi:LamG domain-containing protein [Catellatospora sp. TT07R-123]|uniref:LamG domain-containing protein n=1 Tax=Catellatospora sp. TT07R-123 TaxID=2733863 RepID=UPI001BB36814|nr:LamG domain-containing protein [Catellatospora sp. TT07R-123]
MVDEYATHVANPDGTFTFSASTDPQRVRKARGWVPIDRSLAVVGDRVVPAATLLDVSLSAGGTGDAVVMRDGAASLSLSWPKPLPAPVLDGNVATYPEVIPGVDLRITVEVQSFSQVLVVKTRKAAANPSLARLTWGVRADGVDLRTASTGELRAVDSTGRVVFMAPPATMWDSPAQPNPAQARMLGLPEGETLDEAPASVIGIPAQLSQGRLAVVPDAGMLKAADTTFPVMIDPSFSSGYARWATVEKTAPDTAYQTTNNWPRDYIRAGRAWGETSVWRSLMTFTLTGMAASTLVSNPSFTIRLDHSGACADTPVELWRINYFLNTGVTWNSSKAGWISNYGSRSGSANDSCSAQNSEYLEWSTSAMRSMIQSTLDGGWGTFNVGLKAPNETDENQWKKFGIGTATLEATYNRAPNTPTSATMTDCPAPCASGAYVAVGNPTLKALASDPDGGTLTVSFVVADLAGVTQRSGQVTGYLSGSAAPASWQVSPALPTGVYQWRVQACDAYICGSFTPWFGFTTDLNSPSTPAITPVSPSLYFEDNGSGVSSGGVGVAGSLKLSPANGETDVVAYEWHFESGTVTTVNQLTNYSATISVTPTYDGVRTLWVKAVDVAGRKSADKAYRFLVASPAPDAAVWMMNETTGTTVADSIGSYPATAANVTWAAGKVDNAAQFSGTGAITTAVPVLMTGPDVGQQVGRDFSVSAWVKLTNTSADRVAVAQIGAHQAMFRLGYSTAANGGSGGWCFTVSAADVNSAATQSVCANWTVATGQWVYLTGVFDADAGSTGNMSDNTMTIYVDGGDPFGMSTASAYAAVPWVTPPSGKLTIGRGLVDSTATGYWIGQIDTVRVHQRALTAEDVQSFYLTDAFL